MNSYKVSIVTVCKDSELTIRQTIESVLHQTYRNIEYIIIDGGSTDRTTEIVKEYQMMFEGRLQYISEKDDGIYDAMNKGIMRATGEAIGFINSDDWYELDAVERAEKCFEEIGADAVYGEIWLLDQNGEREYHTWHSSFPPHPATFVRRAVYQKYGMFDLKYRIAADRELLLRLMAEGVSFKRIDAVLAEFRRTGISNTRLLECARETYEIDLKYLGRCSETISREAIEEKYERVQFLYISQTQPQVIQKLLAERSSGMDGVAIFGAGNCGKELVAVLKTSGIPIRLLVDNDERKWGLEYHGIRIYSPEILRDFSGHVIVTMTEYRVEICRQLQSYENPSLTWSVLGEMRKKVIDDFAAIYPD